MKEKRDCKIVQDLLPSYVEKLTNEETNSFVEEHIAKCEECKKILENMSEKIDTGEKAENKEVNYIKKYSKKLKMLRNILLIIATVFIVIIGRRAIILNNLASKIKNLDTSSNVHIEYETYNFGEITTMEIFVKDGKSLSKIKTKESQDNDAIHYEDDSYIIGFSTINGRKVALKTKKTIQNNDVYYYLEPYTDNIVESILEAITCSSVNKVNYKGEECYLVRRGNIESIINIETRSLCKKNYFQ